MSKEAMKLALEALKQIDEAMPFPVAKLAQAALRKALAEQPAQTEVIAGRTVKVDWKTQALELRELVRLGGIKIAELEMALAEQSAQQEPVAWMYPDDYERMTTSETFCTVYSVEVGSATRGESTVALYTSLPAQRKPLTDEDCTRIYNEANGITTKNPPITTERIFKAMRAAHGIKENT